MNRKHTAGHSPARSLRQHAGLILLTLAALAGCGGSGGGGAGLGPGGGNGTDSFTADIAGAAWASDAAGLIVQAGSPATPGSIIISGTHVVSTTNVTSLVLTLAYIAGPGIYPLGVNQVSTAGGTGILQQINGATVANRTTALSGNAGVVTITSLTATRISGTFAFTATPILGSTFTGDVAVTNGSFDLPLPAGFTSVPAANHGSSVSASLAGAPWNAATVVALGDANAFGFTATSDDYSIAITAATTITPGTYNIGASGFSMQVSQFSPFGGWGGPGSTGTVTVNSFANGRAAGTFEATLAGTGGNLTVTGGRFDVRVDATP